MTITASGMFLLTAEKMRIDTLGQSFEAETHKALMTTDTYAPNFDTHDFRNDVTDEVSGTGYTTGGVTVTTTDITVGSPVAGSLKWDHDDVSWAASTITSAMCLIHYFNIGSAATDALGYLLDFVTAASTSNGLFLVQIHANGAVNEDLTP